MANEKEKGLLGKKSTSLLFRKTLIDVSVSLATNIHQIEITAACPNAPLSDARFVSESYRSFGRIGICGFVENIDCQSDLLNLEKFINVSGSDIAYYRNSRSQVLSNFCRRRSNL